MRGLAGGGAGGGLASAGDHIWHVVLMPRGVKDSISFVGCLEMGTAHLSCRTHEEVEVVSYEENVDTGEFASTVLPLARSSSFVSIMKARNLYAWCGHPIEGG